MHHARVYRHSDTRQAVFAELEAPDLFGLLVLFLLLMVVQRHAFFLNIAAVLAAYVAIRVAKRGKPPGYTTALARYTVRAATRKLHLSASAPTP